MRSLYIYSIITLFFYSCTKKEEVKPKVSYTKKENVEVKKDTSKFQVADLPINFEGSDVLVFPVGEVTVGDISKRGSYDSSNSYSNKTGFSVSNSMENEISGFLSNLKFQSKDSDSIYNLTDKVIFIESVSFIKNAKSFVYLIEDNDTNQDSGIDDSDIKTLYVSSNLGKNFIKISPELQEIIDWKYIASLNRIYFRTQEDSNKNGQFDKKDGLHYFYYDFKNSKSIEYFPLK